MAESETLARPATESGDRPGAAPVLAAAWDRYYETLGSLRDAIERSTQFRDHPDQRARAYHALFETQAMIYNFALAPKLAHPRLFRALSWQTEVYTIGGNGPDFHYATVFLDGRQTYRLTGRLNDSPMLLVQLNSALPGSPGATLLANYDFSRFEIAADGSFEVILSAQKRDGNWIGLDPDSGYQWMLFRPAVLGWTDRPADLEIERISPIAPDHYDADEFDETAIARRIDAATDLALYFTHEWTIGFQGQVTGIAGGVNRLASLDRDTAGEVGSPTADYVMGGYEVENDEALLIELDRDPGGVYWSFALFDAYLRTLDFRTRQGALNRSQVARDADGGIRLVVSKRDPGIANWLDNGGVRNGMLLLRNYRSDISVVPRITRVPFGDLGAHLPADTKRVTPDERAAELARRREAYRFRHGE